MKGVHHYSGAWSKMEMERKELEDEMKTLQDKMEALQTNMDDCKGKMKSHQQKVMQIFNESKAYVENTKTSIDRQDDFGLEDAKLFYDSGLLKTFKKSLKRGDFYKSFHSNDKEMR